MLFIPHSAVRVIKSKSNPASPEESLLQIPPLEFLSSHIPPTLLLSSRIYPACHNEQIPHPPTYHYPAPAPAYIVILIPKGLCLFQPYRLDSKVSQSPYTGHCTPVELHTTADMIRATPKHHNTMIIKHQVMFLAIVCHVQIICLGWVLGCHCVDLMSEESASANNSFKRNTSSLEPWAPEAVFFSWEMKDGKWQLGE